MAAGTDNTINTNSWTSTVSADTTAKKKSSGIDMQGFLKIMAAQMQNQSLSDSGSSTDNSQYVTEMALFSAIQAMNTQTSESNKQYAASLVGSNVLVNTDDSTTGDAKQVSGVVSKAVFNETTGESSIQIGDKAYDLSSVAEVLGSANTQNAMSYMLTAREYAISLVGKNVVVDTTDKDGKDQTVTGVVQSVSFDPTTDAASITLQDGKTYSAGNVAQILETSNSSNGGTNTQQA